MWLFELFKLFYIFSVSLLPVIIDTGVQVWISISLTFVPFHASIDIHISCDEQVWNGMEINATNFVRTEEWQCTHDCPGTNARKVPNHNVPHCGQKVLNVDM